MKRTLFIIIRILLAGLFIFSGIAKLISIDAFETYVYNLSLFPLELTIALSRLLIGVELILGSFFLFNLLPKTTWYLSISIILGFSVFLFIQLASGSEENCNCFGEVVRLSPLGSLIKNLFIILLLFLLKFFQKHKIKKIKVIYAIPVLLICFIIPFIFNPSFKFFQKHKDFHISDFTQQSEIIKNKFIPVDDFNLYTGKKVVCFYSLKCVYCIRSSKKMSKLADQLGITDSVLVFFMGKEENVEWFYNVSKSTEFKYRLIDKKEMSIITDGKIPRVFLIDDGIVKNVLRYSDITEKELKKFMNFD